MIRTATGLTLAAFAAVLSLSIVAGPLSGSALAAGTDTPSPPPTDSNSGKGKKSGQKGAAIERPDFLQNYRAAYAAVYDRQDYTGALAQLQALGADDRADVANLIGYANRKLGNYQAAQIWYERALKADPAHVRSWQYYGLWQVEQGNRDQAQYHLTKIGALCGTDCDEYRSLAAALQQAPGSGLTY